MTAVDLLGCRLSPMATGRMLGSVFFLLLLHHAICHPEGKQKICEIKAHRNDESFWQHAHSNGTIGRRNIVPIDACCDGYVHEKTPMCYPQCPLGSCISAYCPPDDTNVNCYCYDDNFHPSDDSECLPVCATGVGQDVCTCHPGFSKDERTKLCVPTECFARCVNGECDHKGTCFCKSDYMEKIKRDFERCLNGTCHENGTCECEKGFREYFVAANGSCTDLSTLTSVEPDCEIIGGCYLPWIIRVVVGTLICVAIVAGVGAVLLVKRYNNKITYRPKDAGTELHKRIELEDEPEPYCRN